MVDCETDNDDGEMYAIVSVRNRLKVEYLGDIVSLSHEIITVYAKSFVLS